jgi:uncharacterized protein YdaU (DUF1376 family)
MSDDINGKPFKFEAGFFLFPDRFARSCQRVGMTNGERYSYLMILWAMYSQGGHISWDECRGSANISRYHWKIFEPKLLKLLHVEPAGFTHPMVLQQLEKAQSLSASRRAAAMKRWDARSDGR